VRLRAWTHVHTVLSKDSDLGHGALAAAAADAGVDVVFLTEHREAMDDAAIRDSVERCAAASTAAVLLVPGFEIVTAERYHMLAFGLHAPVEAGTAAETAERIRGAGGAPSLAHPSRYPGGWEACVGAVGALEVWNRHYDGRVAPWPAAVAALRRAAGVRATFGLDAHGEEALAGRLPEVILDADSREEAVVVAALGDGRFETALAGRPLDALRGGGLRGLFGRGYRALRRGARRVALAVGVPAGIRKRVGRKW
jgi:hypothetical protein